MHAISQGVGRAGGAVAALAAGADLVCIGNPAYPDGYDAEGVLEELVTAVERALAEGALTEARLWEAAERVKAVGSRAVSCARSDAPRVPARRGIEVARRTLTVRGDVGVRGAATVLATRTVSGYAAGRVPSSLLAELRERRPDWRYVEDATVADLPDQQGDVVLVVEGFRSDEAEQAVRAVLAARPDAVVVYGRLASAEDLGERRVQLHGAGAAAARATADLLVGGRR
jgi:beta-N-acetylhexosaminidase